MSVTSSDISALQDPGNMAQVVLHALLIIPEHQRTFPQERITKTIEISWIISRKIVRNMADGWFKARL